MKNSAKILVVDDNESNRDILHARLQAHGYQVIEAADGEEAISATYSNQPDLILLDVMMPKLDGIEVCRRLKADASLPFIPIILVTAKSDTKDVVIGLEAGADEYLTKPVDQTALVARVKSVLRIKYLCDQVQNQAAELSVWNRTLEQRVADQLGEIDRVGRLKRFLSPQIVKVIAEGDERLLESHRRDVAVVVTELRGFGDLAEGAEPEEVMSVLQEYHGVMGALIHQFEGTLERFAGERLVVLFNDPLPCPAPAVQAVKLATAMRKEAQSRIAGWKALGHELTFVAGVAQGYATLGRIGFEGRFDYAAVGSVVNLANRLCSEATENEILVDSKVRAANENTANMDTAGELLLKGFHRPVPAFNVTGLQSQS